MILLTVVYHGSCTHRMWRYTRIVYCNRFDRFKKGQLCPEYEHYMRTQFIEYLQVFEDVGTRSMPSIPADLKWVHTTVLLEGSHRVLDFVGRRLFCGDKSTSRTVRFTRRRECHASARAMVSASPHGRLLQNVTESARSCWSDGSEGLRG